MQREPRHEDYTDALDWKWEGFGTSWPLPASPCAFRWLLFHVCVCSARKTYIVVELLPAVTALWAFDSWRHNELDGLVYNATGSNFSTSSPNTGVMLRKLASFDGIDTFLLVFILYQFILAIYNLRGIFKHGFERAIDVDLDVSVFTREPALCARVALCLPVALISRLFVCSAQREHHRMGSLRIQDPAAHAQLNARCQLCRV